MNLGSLSEEGIRKFGEYESCYFEGRWYTNVELNRISRRLANGLKSLGIGKGDRVVMQLPNCVEIFAVFSAVFKIGAVIVPMNPILRPDQMAYIYKDCGAKATVISSDYLPWIEAAHREAPDLKNIVLVDKEDVEGTVFFKKLVSDNSEELKILDMDNDDMAALIYTSGTTGNPKGVMHTHYSLWMNAVAFADFLLISSPTTLTNIKKAFNETNYQMEESREMVTGVDRGTMFLAVLPLSHSYGISFMNLGFLVGARSVMLKWWNPLEALKAIQNFRINYLALVPTMYVQLLDHPDFAKYDISSLKYCNSGAAALDPEIAAKWKERMGISIHEGWGLTESGATTAGNPMTGEPKIGSIGVNMLKCNSMKVFDSEDKELPAGQKGEIVIKGPAIMKGYWNLPDETAETLRDGWLHTGDIGYMDEDGYFYITDRKKDLIIRGGENISPKEVEEVICRHAKVYDAGCVGIKDRVYGEEVMAFVVLKQGEKCSEYEIIQHCKKFLPTFKTPKQVRFVGSLPKNILGKLLRTELKKME